MTKLVNRAKMTTNTTGTGLAITLDTTAVGYQSFADAGVVENDVVRYVIEDGSNWEIGLGTYTPSPAPNPPSLTRGVTESSNGGGQISLSGDAVVFLTAGAEDVFNDNYHPNADKWTEARQITLSGDASGSVILDGSSDVTLSVAVADDSHNHLISNIDGLQTNLNLKVNTSTQVTGSNGLTGGGALSGNITIRHANTSNQSSVNNIGRTYIQDIELDDYGHVTLISSATETAPLYSAGNGIDLNSDTFSVTAGGGLVQEPTGLAHADTSAQASLDALTGADVVSDINLDIYGHVTGLSTRTMTLSDLGYTGETNATADQTITAGSGLTGGGTGDVTISHADTSSQASVNNSNGSVIQDVTLDTYGHVTGLVSYDLDGRYYTETEADSRFVNVTGDTMTGLLIAENGIRVGTGDHNTAGRASITFGEGTTTTDSMYIEYDGENLSGDNNAIIMGSTQAGVGDVFSVTYGGAVKVGSNNVFHDGYHPNADKWTEARTLSLTGAVTGSASIDGSGDVSLATTATADPTLTIDGDASGSATFTNLGNATLTLTVADDSHTHDGRYYTESEADSRFVNVTGDSMTGDLSFGDSDKAIFGAGSDLQIYHDGGNSFINDTGTGDLNIRGSSVRIGGVTGTPGATFADGGFTVLMFNGSQKLSTNSLGVSVSGLLQTTSMSVSGNIGVGGTVDGRDVAADGFKLDGIEAGATADQTASEILTAIKTVDGSGSGLDADLLDGQHGSYYYSPANAPDPTLTINGDASGSATFTNLGNATLTLTIADDSHNHTIANVDGLQTALDGKLSTTGKAADSDLLDGLDQSVFMRKSANSTLDMNNNNITEVNHIQFNDPGPGEGLEWVGGSGWQIYESPDDLATNTGGNLQFVQGTTREMTLNTSGSLYTAAQGTLWGSSNDGSGSGLDADLLDGIQGSSFLRSDTADTATGRITFNSGINVNQDTSIYFEAGKHLISYNDGQGNFNIRVGQDESETVTEAGYAFHDEWSQSGGWRQFNVSSASLSTGNSITWRTQMEYDANSVYLRYQGSTKLQTTSTGITVTGSVSGDLSGNATTASSLATARTIALSGDVSGSTSFDGSGNVTITTTVADDSHNHVISNIDGLQTALDGKADASHTHSYLPLTGGTLDNGTSTTLNIKCDDGGQAMLRVNGDNQGTGIIEVGQSSTYGGGISYNGDGSPAFVSGETADNITFYRLEGGTRTEVFHYPYNSNTVNFNATPTVGGSSVWHAGNDGSGSGLDADLLDGQQGSYYYPASNPNGYTTYSANQALDTTSNPTFNNAYIAGVIYHSGDTDTYMQFHAADQWRVVTGGTERFEINNSDVTVQSALKEKYVALSGTTPSIDVDAGGAFSLTTSGNTTFTFAAFTSALSSGFVLELTAGGAHTITWPASVDWAGGTAPDAPASGEKNLYVFWSRDGGTTWYGVLSSAAAA